MTKQECAKRVWAVANKLRGSIKANNYKDYILGLIFYKFVSDEQKAFMEANKIEHGDMVGSDGKADEGTLDFIAEKLGYAIPWGCLWSDWKAKSHAGTLGMKDLIAGLDGFEAHINQQYRHVFSGVFGVVRTCLGEIGHKSVLGDKAIRDMVDVIDDVDEGDGGYDVLGYVYEFLIKEFSNDAKSDGAFYTPHEVSGLIAEIVAKHVAGLGKDGIEAYDPTSGSGGLLMAVGRECGKCVDKDRIKYYAQEKITETYHLTRMNLVMKGVHAQNICVRNGDTLRDDWPYFDDNAPGLYKPLFVDAVVSNPPYSLHWDPDSMMQDPRFRKYGLASSGKADYAFLLHCLYHLKPDGIACIVLPHGVLFRGASEGNIRRTLVENHNIETVIGLPANLFFDTGIPTVVMVLKKQRTDGSILFIDASGYFSKGKAQNVLRACDVRRIVDAVDGRRDIPGFAHVADMSEIEANGFNLNIPRYVGSVEDRKAPDLAGLMSGQVPEASLAAWSEHFKAAPGLKSLFFGQGMPGYLVLKDVAAGAVASDPDVMAFKDMFRSRLSRLEFDLERVLVRDDYAGMDVMVAREECEKVLYSAVVDGVGLVDRYEAFQCFDDGWRDIEEDLEVLSAGGLGACRVVSPHMVTVKGKTGDMQRQDGYVGDILPFGLVGETYFAGDYKSKAALESDSASLESEVLEIFEGLDEETRAACGGDKPKTVDVKRYMKENGRTDELQSIVDKMEESKLYARRVKDVEARVDGEIKAKIEGLSDRECKDLLLKKWARPIVRGLEAIVDGEFGKLASAMVDLRKQYGRTLMAIDDDLASTGAALAGMLLDMSGSVDDDRALGTLAGFLGGAGKGVCGNVR